LAPIIERLRRAGTRNVQVHDDARQLDQFREKLDVVLVDAPCTGTGTWRRRPDTKWRLTPRNLEERVAQQQEALGEAAAFVKPGGSLVYVTCSVLPEENDGQIERFCETHPEFSPEPVLQNWNGLFGGDTRRPRSRDGKMLTLTPASTGTDGFFFCRMRRQPSTV
jgi:16S rRNA (cytosine967-C5)-methyltransferase